MVKILFAPGGGGGNGLVQNGRKHASRKCFFFMLFLLLLETINMTADNWMSFVFLNLLLFKSCHFI